MAGWPHGMFTFLGSLSMLMKDWRSHKPLCAVNCYVTFNSGEVTQTFLCSYHELLCDLRFSFMWGHTNLFIPIPSIVMWPSILFHVRSPKPFYANTVNCYVTFDSHSCEVTQLFVPIQSIAMWPSNLVKVKLYQGIYISKSKPIGNLTQIVLLTNYLHSQNRGLRMKS
jgi:hypothetical protein